MMPVDTCPVCERTVDIRTDHRYARHRRPGNDGWCPGGGTAYVPPEPRGCEDDWHRFDVTGLHNGEQTRCRCGTVTATVHIDPYEESPPGYMYGFTVHDGIGGPVVHTDTL